METDRRVPQTILELWIAAGKHERRVGDSTQGLSSPEALKRPRSLSKKVRAPPLPSQNCSLAAERCERHEGNTFQSEAQRESARSASAHSLHRHARFPSLVRATGGFAERGGRCVRGSSLGVGEGLDLRPTAPANLPDDFHSRGSRNGFLARNFRGFRSLLRRLLSRTKASLFGRARDAFSIAHVVEIIARSQAEADGDLELSEADCLARVCEVRLTELPAPRPSTDQRSIDWMPCPSGADSETRRLRAPADALFKP